MGAFKARKQNKMNFSKEKISEVADIIAILERERDLSLAQAAAMRELRRDWQASAWSFTAERLQKVIGEIKGEGV